MSLSKNGEPPEWVQLVPSGKTIKSLDGRSFSNAKPQAVVDAFNADPRDLPVDWEHSTEIKAKNGDEAPAAGWITAMEVRDGAIWGRVEWTPRGLESLKTKEYRYISPSFFFAKATKIVQEIVSAALTNRPALDMPAVARATDEPTENAMDPKMLELLGLAADATPEQVTAAITKLKSDPVAELETVKTELETARSKLAETKTELANARNANPELDKFVPRADYDLAVARAKKLEDEKVETEKKAHKDAVELAVTSAMKEGKVTPASKDFYLATCSTAEGLEKFREFVKNAPVVGDPSDLDKRPAPVPSGTANDDELAVARSFGMTKEEYLKSRGEAFAQ